MFEVVEKRTVKIPPCRIDKNLVKEIGELLESENLQLGYSLDSKTKDIISNKVDDFVKADWGTDINRIRIDTGMPTFKAEINFRSFKLSEFSVSGKDPTWVNGITNRVEEIFKKYKLGYYPVKTNKFIQILLTGIIAIILSYPILLVASSIFKLESTTNLYVIVIYVVGAFGLGIHVLVQWLFPYFDYGETLQKRMRKWIIVLLFGSGLVPALILKILGL